MSEKLLVDYESALSLSEVERQLARSCIKQCADRIAVVFSQYDLILTPASPGCAPKGLGSTGDPVFNRMWTALGLPCISLPCARNDEALPLGLQLVGPYGRDTSLLTQAAWFEEILSVEMLQIH